MKDYNIILKWLSVVMLFVTVIILTMSFAKVNKSAGSSKNLGIGRRDGGSSGDQNQPDRSKCKNNLGSASNPQYKGSCNDYKSRSEGRVVVDPGYAPDGSSCACDDDTRPGHSTDTRNVCFDGIAGKYCIDQTQKEQLCNEACSDPENGYECRPKCDGDNKCEYSCQCRKECIQHVSDTFSSLKCK